MDTINTYTGGMIMSHDVNVRISMRVPTNSLNHVVADDVKRLLISNGYDVKHVNVQLAIPIGDSDHIATNY